MTSRQHILFRSRALSLGLSAETKPLRTIALAALIASSLSMAGCQQMGFRDRNEELKRMIAEQDDWALPQSAPIQSATGKVPRPNPVDLSGRKRSDLAKRPFISTTEADLLEPQRLAKQDRDSHASEEEDDVNIINTSEQEMDIERDLATLPSAYREILKKQLAIAQQKSRENPRDPRITNEETKVASQESIREKASSKVTVKMSDSNPDDSNAVAAKHTAPTPIDSSVVSAVANTQPVTSSPDAIANQVMKASGVMPVSSSTPTMPATPSLSNNPPSLSNSQSNTAPPANYLSWRQLLSQTIEQLEKQIKEIPETDENLRINQEVTLRMLYLSQRRLDDASREISVLSEQEQEYFRHQLQALYEASNPDAMPARSRRWSLVMNSQREATNRLASISNLEVKSAAFCTKVDGYGSITKFPKYYFEPDQELLLYCEIENVAASKVKDGYESQLQGSYEIIDSQGRKVADQLLPVEAEICQNHRRDYFIVYKIYMPQQIAPGNYQLRLMVEDSKARKFGQSNLDFQIKK